MKRNVLLVFTIVTLFMIPLGFVHAVPLESFAENPIPYWDDNSAGVDIDWSADAQTVTFANNSDVDREDWGGDVWTESFTDISNWGVSGFEGNDAVSTDGDVLTFVCEYDAGNVYDTLYTNDISITSDFNDYYLEFNFYTNETSGTYIENMFIYIFDEDDLSGNFCNYQMSRWISTMTIVKIPFNEMGDYALLTAIECIRIQLRAATGEKFEFYSDYMRFGPLDELEPKLDVGVPLEIGITQSIECMGNFSALNSTVRFQMYDNDTASDLWCDVNSTHVTFPNDDYALFTNIARINFSLDEERILFRIYVFAQNMTLINFYSDYVGLANKDYIRMTSTAFNGTYELWYLQGDIGYIEEVIDMSDNMFYQIFLSTEIWGWFGPLIIIGVSSIILTNKKLKPLGILFIILEFLIISQYFELVGETPWYWWNIIIMLLGMIICVGQMWSK